MQEIFMALINQLNSSVFVLIAILVLAFLGMYKIGKWAEKFKHQDEKITGLGDLSKEVVIMKTKVDLIYQYLNPHSPVKSMSPLTLTDTGEKIINNINGYEIFKKYISELTKEMELYSPKTAYDIQMCSMKAAKEKLINFVNENELNSMKEEAYRNGILLEDVLSIFGILLRNHILQEKGIPISDVDKHTSGQH